MAKADVAKFLASAVAVEEKVDGANLGLSLSPEGELRLQNRGQYLQPPYVGQFARLAAWLSSHAETIRNELIANANAGLMLFGEWCTAKHSLAYDRLPDWFLLFDVYETAGKMFWSSPRRDSLAQRLGLATVPRLAVGRYKLSQLKAMLNDEPSRLSSGALEGVVMRCESPTECLQRAKLVRADFAQGIDDHWRNRPIEWNRLASASYGTRPS
ncbi:MAG: DNA ligase [Burkholderiales bacterium PBB4]|nr:MAG: DNA ligase [Burkholderiales bacterium PBB4]